MFFQERSYEGGRFCGTVRVAHLTHFRAIQSLSDSEAMKLHKPFCADELEDMKGELFQALFKIQTRVVWVDVTNSFGDV
jgi:hypothetical protein